MNDREKVFGSLPEGTYMYCISCERTYLYGEHRIILDRNNLNNYIQMCPYIDCNGDSVIDAKEWNAIRVYHPNYPEIPLKDIIYPLN